MTEKRYYPKKGSTSFPKRTSMADGAAGGRVLPAYCTWELQPVSQWQYLAAMAIWNAAKPQNRVGLERPSNTDAHAHRVRVAEWQGLEPQEPQRALPPLDGDAARAAAALLAAAAPPAPPEWAGQEGKKFLDKKLNDLIFSEVVKTVVKGKDGAIRKNTCNFCGDSWTGTETRGKAHLLQKKNGGVSICHPFGSVKKQALQDLQAEIIPVVEALEELAQDEVKMRGSDLKRKHASAVEGGDSVKAALFAEELRTLPKTQGKLTHMVVPRPDHRNKPDQIKEVDKAFNLWRIRQALPASIVRGSATKEMVNSVQYLGWLEGKEAKRQQAGPTLYKPPGEKELEGRLLDDLYVEAKERAFASLRAEAENCPITISTDGCSFFGDPMINIMANSEFGSVFMEAFCAGAEVTKGAAFVKNYIDRVIKEFGDFPHFTFVGCCVSFAGAR